MYQHHQETVNKVVSRLENREEVIGALLTGSIAHGFAKANSDVDILIIVTEAYHKEMAEKEALTFVEFDYVEYDGGYVDCKYISLSMMENVADKGSEPARFAFEGATILFQKDNAIEALLKKIVTYPVALKENNIKRFYAQVEAWHWYYYEAIKHENNYLKHHSINNLVLFGGRIVLAVNEVLYPYHKWFLKVLSKVEHQPDSLFEIIERLYAEPKQEDVERYYKAIKQFINITEEHYDWGNQFMQDSELNWIHGMTPVADL